MTKKNYKYYPENWIEIAYKIKMRDGWRCQECGLQFSEVEKRVKDKNGKTQTLGVHHKDRNTMNSDPDNLITLCSACHCRAEWPLIRAEIKIQKNKNQLNLFGDKNE